MKPTRRLAVSAATACLALVGLACDSNIEPFVEGEQPRTPDLSRIFPAGAEEAPPPGQRIGMGGSGPRAGAGEAAAPSGADAIAQGGDPIVGEIQLAAGATPAPGGILFVIARAAASEGGPPLAVVRIPGASFPQPFSIGPENVMIPDVRFEGAIRLSARLDADGNAMTRDDADLEATVSSPLVPGASGVELLLQ